MKPIPTIHYAAPLHLAAKLAVVTFIAGVVSGRPDLMMFGVLMFVFRLISQYLILMERRGQTGWPVLLISMIWGVLLTMTLTWLIRSAGQVFAH